MKHKASFVQGATVHRPMTAVDINHQIWSAERDLAAYRAFSGETYKPLELKIADLKAKRDRILS